MKINRDKPYLFRMTNMEDDKQRYTLLIQDDKRGR